MQLHQIRGYERRMYPKFNTVHLMTEVDATYLKQLNGDIHTTVIANGVDNKLFKISLENEKPGTVVFVGELKGSNLLGLRRFIEEGWPIVLDRCPDAQLKVVGGMVEECKKWQRGTSFRNVCFEGYVEDLVDVYAKPRIAVIPVDKDSGIMNKAIEAMASGVVPVGFHNGFKGMKGARDGSEYLAGDDFSDIGELISQLLLDEERCKKMAVLARNCAKANYSWDSKVGLFENMYAA